MDLRYVYCLERAFEPLRLSLNLPQQQLDRSLVRRSWTWTRTSTRASAPPPPRQSQHRPQRSRWPPSPTRRPKRYCNVTGNCEILIVSSCISLTEQLSTNYQISNTAQEEASDVVRLRLGPLREGEQEGEEQGNIDNSAPYRGGAHAGAQTDCPTVRHGGKCGLARISMPLPNH